MRDPIGAMMKAQRLVVVVSLVALWAVALFAMPRGEFRPDIVPMGPAFIGLGLALSTFGWRFLLKPGPNARQGQFSLRLSGAALCAMGGLLLGTFSGHPAWTGPGVAVGIALALMIPIPAAPIDDAAPIEL